MENEAGASLKAFSISQYNTSIKRLLKGQVPKIWVRGVITQLNVRGRICYITLGEFLEGNPSPVSVLQVYLWSSEFETYNLRFATLANPFSLRVELKICAQLEADYYVPSGKFQAKILAIDENFTLGELVQTRQKILKALMAEGLLQKNKALIFSPRPLRIGLITAPNSAAYNDFTSVLIRSGFSFQIFFHPAKMQGSETESDLVAALGRLSKKKLDVIAIIRGGGSKTDLVYFDSEAICRAIANAPVPVLTGIGHEIDNSLADLVAFSNLITPTDCAKFLEMRLQTAMQTLFDAYMKIKESWRSLFQESTYQLREASATLNSVWDNQGNAEKTRCIHLAKNLIRLSHSLLQIQKEQLRRNQTGLMRGPGKIIELQRALFGNRAEALSHHWSRARQRTQSQLSQQYLKLRLGVQERVRREQGTIPLKEKLLNAVDPAKMLARGYIILKSEKGEWIRSTQQLKTGEVLDGYLVDGKLKLQVNDIVMSKAGMQETLSSDLKLQSEKMDGKE